MNEISTIISTVGFPIFSFLLSSYFIKYTYDKNMANITQLTEAVNNNTLVLTKLVEKIGEEKGTD